MALPRTRRGGHGAVRHVVEQLDDLSVRRAQPRRGRLLAAGDVRHGPRSAGVDGHHGRCLRYGGHADDIPVLLRRTLAAPPLWVLAAALTANLAEAPIPRNFLHVGAGDRPDADAAGPAGHGLAGERARPAQAGGDRRRRAALAVRLGRWAWFWSGCSASPAALPRLRSLARRRRSASPPWSCRRAKDWIWISPPAPRPSRFSWDRCGFRWPCFSFRVESRRRAAIRVAAMYTASSAILEALVDAGVEYLFANFGSDHPGLIEAIAHGARREPTLSEGDHVPDGDGGHVGRPWICAGQRARAGRARARGLRHPGTGRRRTQRRQGPCARVHPRGSVACHAGRRGARQPQRIHPVDPGRARSARPGTRLRALRKRDPRGRQCTADRAPGHAVRLQRAARAGVCDGRARSAGERGAARDHRRGPGRHWRAAR